MFSTVESVLLVRLIITASSIDSKSSYIVIICIELPSRGNSDRCNQALCLQYYSRLVQWGNFEGEETCVHQRESLHSRAR